MKSQAYRDLPIGVVLEIAAISKKIDRMARQLHDAPNGKLMYVSFSVAAHQYNHSVDFRNQRHSQLGGVCGYKTLKGIEAHLKVLEAAIRLKMTSK